MPIDPADPCDVWTCTCRPDQTMVCANQAVKTL